MPWYMRTFQTRACLPVYVGGIEASQMVDLDEAAINQAGGSIGLWRRPHVEAKVEIFWQGCTETDLRGDLWCHHQQSQFRNVFIRKKMLNLRQRLLQASRNYSYYTIGLYHKCGQFKFLDFHHMDVLDFRLFFGPFGQLEGGRASEADQVTLK